MAIDVTQYLDWFSKSDVGDTVTFRVLYVVTEDGVEMTRSVRDRYGSDAVLVARAVADGRNTWDEDDLCAEYGLTRSPTS